MTKQEKRELALMIQREKILLQLEIDKFHKLYNESMTILNLPVVTNPPVLQYGKDEKYIKHLLNNRSKK